MNIGIIGLGKMGQLHLNKLRELFPSQAIHTFDVNSDLSSHRELKNFFYDIDAVVIASPTATHYSYAKLALELGVHVLVEKPICEKIGEAQQLVSLSQRNDLVLAVGFLERFRLKFYLDEQQISSPMHIVSHRESTQIGRDPSTDVIMDLLIHDIDLVLSLIKEEIVDIKCWAKKEITKVWDEAKVDIKFSGGSSAIMTASRIAKNLKRTFEVQNKFKFDFTEKISFDPLLEQTKNFIHCIQNKSQPLVTSLDGLKSLEVATRIQHKLSEPAINSNEIRI